MSLHRALSAVKLVEAKKRLGLYADPSSGSYTTRLHNGYASNDPLNTMTDAEEAFLADIRMVLDAG